MQVTDDAHHTSASEVFMSCNTQMQLAQSTTPNWISIALVPYAFGCCILLQYSSAEDGSGMRAL